MYRVTEAATRGDLACDSTELRIHVRPWLTLGLTVSADVAGICVAGVLAILGWHCVNTQVDPARYLGLWPVMFAYLSAYAFFGLYPGVGLSPPEELRRIWLATSAVSLTGAVVLLLARDAGFSRGVFTGSWGLILLLVPTARAGMRKLFSRRPWWGVPVVILGAGHAGRNVLNALLNQPTLGLKPVAIFDDDPDKLARFDSTPVIGPLDLASAWAVRHRVHHAVIAMPSLRRSRLLEILEACGSHFRHLILLPDLLGVASLWVAPKDFGGVLGLEIRNNLRSPVNQFLKRTLDLVSAVVMGLAGLPVVLLAALAVKVVSPGPAFFVQEREGQGGRIVRVFKLRTMRTNAEELLREHLERNAEAKREWLSKCKLRDDPRLIPVLGRLLRRTSIDELPQLWNILKGEMSLVGPRPLPGYHLALFPEEFRRFRAQVRPGVTGLWQVVARGEGDKDSYQTLDSYYIRNWSLWLDLWVLARTVGAVVAGRGAY